MNSDGGVRSGWLATNVTIIRLRCAARIQFLDFARTGVGVDPNAHTVSQLHEEERSIVTSAW